jgi:uncharacterized protein (TIGR03492 family)
MLEVAFITDAPRVAGSEIWLLERLPGLASLGLQPTLFLPQRPNLDAFAEDLIGATLCQQLEGLRLAALPVGPGKRYEGRVERILGPRKQMPSGGFPFNSLENLLADLQAGFLQEIYLQIRAAQLARREVRAVAAVGDAYALAVGVLASNWGQLPLFHLQPQISHYYWAGRSVWERLRQPNQFGAEDYMFYERWMHRFVRAVYVRDKPSEQRAHQLGMHKARFVGSMAMDTLGPPNAT